MTIKHKRQKPEIRKEAIIAEALRLATVGNYDQVQRKQIADNLGVSPPALTYHFGTMPQLKRAVMRAAIAAENLKVIAQGLVAQDEHAKKAPAELQQRALDSFKRLV